MTDQTNIQFKGLIRFAYIAARPKAARKGVADPATAAQIFAADQVDVQLALFDYFTLPALRRQTDQGFAAVILTSEAAPEPVLKRLLEMIESLANVTLLALPPLPLGAAATRAFRQIDADPKATHVATFRLDEGAAIEDGAVARLRAVAENKIALDGPDTPFAIGFNKGFALHLGAQDGAPRLHDVVTRTPQSNGLTFVTRSGAKTHVFGIASARLSQHVDMITDATHRRFLQAGMMIEVGGGDMMPSDPDVAATDLRSRFGLSYDELERG